MTRPVGTELRFEIPDELVDAIVERVLERLPSTPPDIGWLRGADAIANYIGAKPSRVYALSSAGRIPVERDGSGLVARREVLDRWLEAGGAKRP